MGCAAASFVMCAGLAIRQVWSQLCLYCPNGHLSAEGQCAGCAWSSRSELIWPGSTLLAFFEQNYPVRPFTDSHTAL